jgi:hypothetical protein
VPVGSSFWTQRCWQKRSGTVLSEKSIGPPRGSMIIAEEPAKARPAMDVIIRTRWCGTFWRNSGGRRGHGVMPHERRRSLGAIGLHGE